ncbi:hypothetical protein KDW_48360 [Dictyobacter vulcani]|uniref:Uncharacterized protein n=1 Tax=Dictyobacter vulcani TaxID=2607529 RepID=A0A5J4KMS4_9CHLR|nr:hypothetical protein KDW_48360 [Dictyobacter vulcani]
MTIKNMVEKSSESSVERAPHAEAGMRRDHGARGSKRIACGAYTETDPVS